MATERETQKLGLSTIKYDSVKSFLDPLIASSKEQKEPIIQTLTFEDTETYDYYQTCEAALGREQAVLMYLEMLAMIDVYWRNGISAQIDVTVEASKGACQLTEVYMRPMDSFFAVTDTYALIKLQAEQAKLWANDWYAKKDGDPATRLKSFDMPNNVLATKSDKQVGGILN